MTTERSVLLVVSDLSSPIARSLIGPFCESFERRGRIVLLAARKVQGASRPAVKLGLPWLSWLDFPLVALQLARTGARTLYIHPSARDYPALWLLKRLSSMRIVGHFHSRPRDDMYAPLAWSVFEGLFDRVLVPSETMKTELAERLPKLASRLRVAPNPAPEKPRPYVLCASRVAFDKGVDVLLMAFRAALDKGLDCDLVVCGGDRAPGKPSLKKALELASLLKLGGRVQFAGELPRERVAQLLSGCLAFCLPSRWEGHSLAMLEALAAGKPVIATRVGGAEETLADGESGLLVPAKDPEALASALLSVARDGRLRRRLSRGARKRAAAFGPDAHGAACLAAVEEAEDAG